ncbi:MAG: baeRF7 domain-containing protein [Candidatus Promineifilaceae bacterium]
MYPSDNVDFERLIVHQAEACVSIFLPTERFGRETDENRIRLKNLLAQTREQLSSPGVVSVELRRPEINHLLEPARDLLDDRPFWENQNRGLALFLSTDIAEIYRVPLPLDEQVVIKDHFYLRPLLPILSTNGNFYLLTLSLGQVKLFRGDLQQLAEVTPEAMPADLAEALAYDDPELELQFHTSTTTPRGGGERRAIFHGDAVSEERKERIHRFVNKVAHLVEQFLGGESAPLALAGVPYILSMYRQANRYPYLSEVAIEGNLDHLNPQQLHDAAVAALDERFGVEVRRALATYDTQKSSERTSDKIDEVVLAAHRGRVDTLLISADKPCWGYVNLDEADVKILGQNAPEALDLVNLAAIYAYRNGGSVYVLTKEEMPDDALVAAIYRY